MVAILNFLIFDCHADVRGAKGFLQKSILQGALRPFLTVLLNSGIDIDQKDEVKTTTIPLSSSVFLFYFNTELPSSSSSPPSSSVFPLFRMNVQHFIVLCNVESLAP
jgi:hypothetical protein